MREPTDSTPVSALTPPDEPVPRPPLIREGGLAAAFRRLRSAAVVGTVGASFAVFFLQAVQGILLARILGPEARGEYGTALFYTQTLTYVGLLGALFSIARHAARHRDRLVPLRRAALRVGLITGCCTMALVVVLASFALPAEKQYLAPLCMACALALPWEHMRLTMLAVDHGSGNFARYNANQLLMALLLPTILLGFWLAGVHNRTVIVLVTIPIPLLALAARLAVCEGRQVAGPASPRPRVLLKEGFPYTFSVVAADLFGRLDVFLILWLTSLTVQGCYAAAVPAANLLIVAPNALALFAFNAGAAGGGPVRSRRVALAGLGVFGFQVLAAAAFAAVLPMLIVLVYGSEFRGAVPLAWALLPAYAMNGCALVADGYLRGRGKSGVGVWSRLSGAAVMGLAVWLLFGTWKELSIPLAASAGHAMNALWLAGAVLMDRRHGSDNGGESEEATTAEPALAAQA